jgi:hypothetical protein
MPAFLGKLTIKNKVIKMKKTEYELANLSDATLEQLRSLEKTLSEEKGEDVVLIAYENGQKEMDENLYKG